MSARPWAVADLPVLTGTQAAAFDRASIEGRGIPEPALMERAGTAAARVVHHLFPRGRVVALAGKGNNGGDALVAARCLRAWGRDVHVVTLRPDMGDPLLHGWEIPSTQLQALEGDALTGLLAGAVAVDGILGTGIRGGARGEALTLIRALNASDSPGVVALDIPSGVDADTGAAGEAVRAEATVAFGWPKLGSLLHPGRALSGRLLAVEIGFPPLDESRRREAATLLTPAWSRPRLPRRAPVTHKNQVGALAVVAGRPGMAGAAVLAARSALRAGAGYVRVVTAPENREVVQGALPEAVFVDATDEAAVDEALDASRAVAVGPGMGVGAAAAALLERVLRASGPRVVDADALTLCAADESLAAGLAGDQRVITPHRGEAGRLLHEVPESPVALAHALRERTGAVALAKGAPSVVVGPAGVGVEAVGNSDLAVAGMGDTLTGCIGGLLAQGVDAQDAAGLGLVLTGRAAALAGFGAGLQSGDVPDHIPAACEEALGEPELPLAGLLLDLDPVR